MTLHSIRPSHWLTSFAVLLAATGLTNLGLGTPNANALRPAQDNAQVSSEASNDANRDWEAARDWLGELRAADPSTRWQAAYSLAEAELEAEQLQAVIRELLLLCNSPQADLRWCALRALGQLDPEGSATRSAVLAATTDENLDVRWIAVESLGVLRCQGKAHARVLAALLSSMEAPEYALRSSALRALMEQAVSLNDDFEVAGTTPNEANPSGANPSQALIEHLTSESFPELHAEERALTLSALSLWIDQKPLWQMESSQLKLLLQRLQTELKTPGVGAQTIARTLGGLPLHSPYLESPSVADGLLASLSDQDWFLAAAGTADLESTERLLEGLLSESAEEQSAVLRSLERWGERKLRPWSGQTADPQNSEELSQVLDDFFLVMNVLQAWPDDAVSEAQAAHAKQLSVTWLNALKGIRLGDLQQPDTKIEVGDAAQPEPQQDANSALVTESSSELEVELPGQPQAEVKQLSENSTNAATVHTPPVESATDESVSPDSRQSATELASEPASKPSVLAPTPKDNTLAASPTSIASGQKVPSEPAGAQAPEEHHPQAARSKATQPDATENAQAERSGRWVAPAAAIALLLLGLGLRKRRHQADKVASQANAQDSKQVAATAGHVAPMDPPPAIDEPKATSNQEVTATSADLSLLTPAQRENQLPALVQALENLATGQSNVRKGLLESLAAFENFGPWSSRVQDQLLMEIEYGQGHQEALAVLRNLDASGMEMIARLRELCVGIPTRSWSPMREDLVRAGLLDALGELAGRTKTLAKDVRAQARQRIQAEEVWQREAEPLRSLFREHSTASNEMVRSEARQALAAISDPTESNDELKAAESTERDFDFVVRPYNPKPNPRSKSAPH